MKQTRSVTRLLALRRQNLPPEVLLEIFDYYRQTFQHEENYERIWNGSEGWFKLAHVCQRWRLVLLTSPSRLHLRLLFTEHSTRTMSRVKKMKHLPPLPIVVDYSNGAWTTKAEKSMVSALSYPDRVCGISFRGSREGMDTLFCAMNRPFPMLDNLELTFRDPLEHIIPLTLIHPLPFLKDKPPPLRRLKYCGTGSSHLAHILSCTKSLVEIDLCVDSILSRRSVFLGYMQNMPFLRRLEIQLGSPFFMYFPVISVERGDVVLLSTLTFLRIIGPSETVDALVADLATPSLQELHISLHHKSFVLPPHHIPQPPLYILHPPFHIPQPHLHIPHLSKFIRNAGMHFHAAHILFNSQQGCDGHTISMLREADSISDPPFDLTIGLMSSMVQLGLGVDLSAMVATVGDLFLSTLCPIRVSAPFLVYPALWHQFFKRFHNVKILRVHHNVGKEVADIMMFRQGDGQPTMDHLVAPETDLDAEIPAVTLNGSSQSAMGIVFPSLEEIELRMGPLDTPIRENELASFLDFFEPFVTTRQQIGHSVKVCWGTDRPLPNYFSPREPVNSANFRSGIQAG